MTNSAPQRIAGQIHRAWHVYFVYADDVADGSFVAAMNEAEARAIAAEAYACALDYVIVRYQRTVTTDDPNGPPVHGRRSA